ncbi:metal tolerance protein C2 isoform X3 [Cynara cardunculus var. scolymus]|uniref:metal tolerance protein C2 isoform X3 n=1 Tax=Cynara cardunculus var. scolymus TaxID=59895 RepID=UPI000D62B885|nr:metal tolerance protein C2 isoform X3 [Cynara cardunculus var. scolymus]
MERSGVSDQHTDSRSPFDYQKLEAETPRSWNAGDFDRRFAFSRQTSFNRQPGEQPPHTPVSIISSDYSSKRPLLSRTSSKIDILPPPKSFPQQREYGGDRLWMEEDPSSFSKSERFSIPAFVFSLFNVVRSGNRPMKRLAMLISLNVACSTAELLIGLISGRVGLVSDAFHLTFGCGLLTFSLFAMTASRRKPDRVYTYGYKRLEVLSAFTNSLFLLFMSFSLAVEALHAFVQDESEHKHYLIVSAVTNLFVNLIGIWFFRNYARISLGLILASWLLSLGVENAEVLCLGLVSFTVFMLAMPLFKTSGGILLQEAPPNIPSSALSKCWRQVASLEDVIEVSQAQFWEFVPAHVVGSVSLQLWAFMNNCSTLLGRGHVCVHLTPPSKTSPPGGIYSACFGLDCDRSSYIPSLIDIALKWDIPSLFWFGYERLLHLHCVIPLFRLS